LPKKIAGFDGRVSTCPGEAGGSAFGRPGFGLEERLQDV